MWMSIGSMEVIVLFGVVCIALMLRRRHSRASHWGMAAAGCLAVAAALTPADPFSMVLAGMLLFGIFTAGVVAAPFLVIHKDTA